MDDSYIPYILLLRSQKMEWTVIRYRGSMKISQRTDKCGDKFQYFRQDCKNYIENTAVSTSWRQASACERINQIKQKSEYCRVYPMTWRRSLNVAENPPCRLATLPEQSSTEVKMGLCSLRVYLSVPKNSLPFFSVA